LSGTARRLAIFNCNFSTGATTMKNVLTLNKVQRGVPAYDIMIDGVGVGVLTHFPHDAKAMATLRLGGVLLTLEAQTIGDLLMKLFDMIVPISDDEIEERVYDEDEDDYFNEEEQYNWAMYLKAEALGYDDPNF
jgi:hypothetical protein